MPTSRPPAVPGRTTARRTLQLLAVGALVAASVSVTESPATATPEQVLQSVRVQVGTDGSITAVDSQAIRKAAGVAGEDPSVDVQDTALDPAAVAGDLPVRVLTSYRLGDRTGTDLRDIEGEAGRVVITLTVQNTTVRPEEVSYDTGNGVGRTDYALVGAPLTVVGSTRLGEGDLARIVTRNDLDPTEITNGVLSQSEDGAAVVQWAAMLAPPRLAASATFSLVEETADFEVPQFDLAVQPGLVTDTSVAALINSAFSDDGGSTVALESRTIEIISNVNSELTRADGVLSDIQDTLADSAKNLGTRTIVQLQRSGTQVDDSLSGLVVQLQQLDDDIERELDSNQNAVVSKLNATLDQVRLLLGNPDALPGFDPGYSTECGSGFRASTPVPDDAQHRSVLFQIHLVGEQLKALRHSSKDCTAEIKDGLLRSIGRSGHCETPEEQTTAVCTLSAAVDTLETRADKLVDFKTDLTTLADPGDAIGALGDLLVTFADRLGQVQVDAAAVGASSTTPVALSAALQDAKAGLATGVTGVQAARDELQDALDLLAPLGADLGDLVATGAPLDDLLAGYATIADTATAEQGAIQTARADAAAVVDALTEACSLPSLTDPANPELLPQDAQDYLDAVGTFLDDALPACQNAPTLGSTLLADLDGRAAAWDTVLAATDVSAERSALADAITGIADDLDTQVDALNTVVSDLDAVLAALTAASGAPVPASPAQAQALAAAIDALDASLAALYDGGVSTAVDATDDVCSPDSDAGRAYDKALRAFHQVECNNQVLTGRIDEEVRAFTTIIEQTRTDMATSRRTTNRARVQADSDLDRVTRRFGEQLSSAGNRIRERAASSVGRQRTQLSTIGATTESNLGHITAEAVGKLSARVGSSSRDLEGTRGALQSDLAAVLFDLGTNSATSSTGILGTLSSSARRTGGSNADLARVGASTDAFRSVRGQELDAVLLEQAQTNRGMELQSQLPGFGLDVPEGSSVLTVFTFHVGG